MIDPLTKKMEAVVKEIKTIQDSMQSPGGNVNAIWDAIAEETKRYPWKEKAVFSRKIAKINELAGQWYDIKVERDGVPHNEEDNGSEKPV